MFEFPITCSIKEAAKLLGYTSPSALRSYDASYKIPGAFKYRTSWRIPYEYIEKYLEEESRRADDVNKVGRRRGMRLKTHPGKSDVR